MGYFADINIMECELYDDEQATLNGRNVAIAFVREHGVNEAEQLQHMNKDFAFHNITETD